MSECLEPQYDRFYASVSGLIPWVALTECKPGALNQGASMNQQERIICYLESGKTLSRLNAWQELGILEAPARISELRAKGHLIKTTMKTVQNRYSEPVRIAHWSIGDDV